jgi:DNA invertase Pin-like site-specific DNA recombinase
VKIRSISDGIDPETLSGRMMLATLAEYERELIPEHVNAGDCRGTAERDEVRPACRIT